MEEETKQDDILNGNDISRKDRGLAFGQELAWFGMGVRQGSKRVRCQGRINQNHDAKASLTDMAQLLVDVLTANGPS